MRTALRAEPKHPAEKLQQGTDWLKANSCTTQAAFTQGMDLRDRVPGSFTGVLLLWTDQKGIRFHACAGSIVLYIHIWISLLCRVSAVNLNYSHHPECACCGVICITQPGSAFCILWGGPKGELINSDTGYAHTPLFLLTEIEGEIYSWAGE